MTASLLKAALCAATLTCILNPDRAFAQSGRPPDTPLDVVVTAARQPQAIQRAGSAIEVIRADEIDRSSLSTVSDLLRAQPGLALVENGGPGKLTNIQLRGAESRHTLVLVDGFRINDTSSTGGEFDFSNLALADVERIEILRGPQSALYGSDAIGGVINIITRKGRGAPRASLTMEAGSYGTFGARASVSGGTRDLSYAFGLLGVRSQGFSAYGYRIPGLASFGPFDKDGFERLAGNARLSWRVADGVEIEAGFYGGRNRSGYDAAFAGFGYLPDTPSTAKADIASGFLRGVVDPAGSIWRHQLTVFGSQTRRVLDDVQLYDFGFGLTREKNRYAYLGERVGAEYQGLLRLGALGSLTFGGGLERESLRSVTTADPASAFVVNERASYQRAAYNAFALHQIALGDRLDLSFGVRLDQVEGVKTFVTGRATAAYRIPESGTRLRASVGTGAKAPSLYQNFSIFGPTRNGDPALKPEESVGVDIGIDQQFLDGRLNLSATLFHNRLRNLIDFDFARGVPGLFGPQGQYINVARARTQGLELSANAVLIENYLSARASYTRLDAIDERTGLRLARRPAHQARLSLAFTPLPKLSIEPTLVVVGERYSAPRQGSRLSPYARLDMRVSYQLNDNLGFYVRAENLTDVRYQEVANYGVTGRAIYAGLNATW